MNLELSEDAYGIFELSKQIEDSDWVLIPAFITELLDEAGKSLIQRASNLAKKSKKPFAVFSNSDFIVDVAVDNAFVFTPGAYRSKTNQISLPATLAEDPYTRWIGTEWKPLIDLEIPTVGFCGQATTHRLKALKDAYTFGSTALKNKLGFTLSNPGPFFLPAFQRAKMLQYFENDSRFRTDFIRRNQYKGGAVNPEQKRQVEMEFFQNINRNLFTICLRGMGNYSVRFYQTLAMGRIPILVETDEKIAFQEFNQVDALIPTLPFNWKDKIPEKVYSYFQSKSKSELIEIQHNCREIWKEYYQRKGLLKYISKSLSQLMHSR